MFNCDITHKIKITVKILFFFLCNYVGCLENKVYWVVIQRALNGFFKTTYSIYEN